MQRVIYVCIYLFIFLPPADLFLNQKFSFLSLPKSFTVPCHWGQSNTGIASARASCALDYSPGELITVQVANLKKEMNTVRPHKSIFCASLENKEIFVSE